MASDERDLSPEEQAAFERVRARSAVRMDTVMMGVLNRAAELARRDDQPTATLSHVLEALLHAKVTPALINHLQAARSITEDERGNEVVYVDDLSVLAAQLADGSSVWQVLDRYVDDMDALTSEIRAYLRDHDGAP